MVKSFPLPIKRKLVKCDPIFLTKFLIIVNFIQFFFRIISRCFSCIRCRKFCKSWDGLTLSHKDFGTPGNIVGGLAGRIPALVVIQSQSKCETHIQVYFHPITVWGLLGIVSIKFSIRFHWMES